MGELFRKANQEDSETEIQTIQHTKSGGILLALGAKTKNKEAFCDIIRGILWEKAVVSALEPRCTLEIRDPHWFSVKEKIKEVLKWDIPDLGEMKIGLTLENLRRQ